MKSLISILITLILSFSTLLSSSLDESNIYEQSNNKEQLQDTLQKAQENVDFTFSPWLKKNNTNRNQKMTQNRVKINKPYKSSYHSKPSKSNIKFKLGLTYKIAVSDIDILYKTDDANDIVNLNKDLGIDKMSNSIGVPIINITFNQKHNFYFSSLNYTSTGSKIFKESVVFNGRTFKSEGNNKIDAKFEYSEYDFGYTKDFVYYDLGIGYKNIQLQTTINDNINTESATSTISLPYVVSALKTKIFDKKLNFIGEFSFFNKELYYKVGSNLYFNSLVIGFNYEYFDYKYTNLQSNGTSLNMIFSYLINFN